MRRAMTYILIYSLPLLLTANPGTLPIGMNLAGPSDYGSEWPFVNIMTFSRAWITFNSTWVENGQNPWDTEILNQIPVDEQGYPLQLPCHVAGAETTQAVRTVWANTSALPQGRYVVLYDGKGRLGFDFDMHEISSAPGRCEVDLIHNGNIAALQILESVQGNHIRNIRVLMPGTEDSHTEMPYCPQWLEKLAPFHTLRFMDWGLTNNSSEVYWHDRPQIGDYTYTLDGIPYEEMIALCNAKKADAWICIPHQANDAYIRSMAQLFYEQMNPELKIYVEYSNEIWNWMFGQTHYCFNNGDQSTEWPERITPFIQNAIDIWSDVFQQDMERLVRVVGVQHSWQDVSNRIVFNMREGSFDAFSPAAYFGFSETSHTELTTLGAAANAEDVLRLAAIDIRQQASVWSRSQFNAIARPLQIPMIYYEAGQHLTPDPFGSDQGYNQALMDAQTHPAMYDLYQEWIDTLQTLTLDNQPGLMMHFSFISPKSGRYGSWGALENQFDQPPYRDSAPKYQALLDNQCTNPTVNTRAAHNPAGFALIQNYPNPFNPSTTINYSLTKAGRITLKIHDVSGRLIDTLADEFQTAGAHTLTWMPGNLPSGLYLLTLQAGHTSITRKLILQR